MEVAAMQRAIRLGLVATLVWLAGWGVGLRAQQVQGSFTGTVTDQSGAVIPGVTVTAVEIGTGLTRRTETHEDGSYEIPLLPPGHYRLSAEKVGFEKITQGVINLMVDAHLKVNLQMRVGAQTTTVTVEATPPVLDTQTSAVGTTVESQEVSEVPLNGRHFLELTLFTPGVVPGSEGSENSERGGAINVNGLRETMNTFLLDGMNNTSLGVGTFVVTPPVDSVQEFRMETALYDAKFGSQAGAQVNVVTKSGTNHFHGTIHEFLRNSKLDARNFFDPSVPPFRRNQFGGTLGGPIAIPGVYDGHDRSFFFLAFEGLRHRRDFFRNGLVPTMAERGGDFSDLLAPDCSSKTVLLNPLALLQGVPQTFTDISEVIPTGPDPTGQAMVQLFPKPNIPNAACGAANYRSEIHQKAGFDNFVGRFDHRWGQKDTMFFRYNLTLDRETHPSDPYPGYGVVWRNGFTQTGLDWTHAFTPTLINEFKLSYNRWQLRWNNEDQGRMVGQELGIVGSPTLLRQTGIPNLSFSGCCSLGAGTNVPQAGAVNTFELAEALTQVHGNHSLTYGVDIRAVKRGNFYIDSVIRNEFDFTGLVTGGLGNLTPGDLGLPSNYALGNGLADAMLGLPTDWIHGASTYISGAGTQYGVFAEDSWKVRKNLTLNLGLRYEYNSLITDKADHFASFDFNQGLLIVAGRKDVTLMNFDPNTGGYVTVGTESLGGQNVNRALYLPDRNNWAPRVGFAWQPFNNSKTVIRAGYGVFYDQTFGDVYLSKAANPPFVSVNLGIVTAALPVLMTNPQLIGTGYLIQNAFAPGLVAPIYPEISPYEFHFQDSTVQEWSFDFQRELPGSWLLDIGYVGTRGLHLPRHTDPNQKIPDPVNQTATRPYPNFDSNFSYTESSASSIYHGLQVKFEKHYSNGMSFIGGYTWSKTLDSVSTFYGTGRSTDTEQNYRNLAAEKGRADFDFRQRLTMAYVYELPFGRKVWRTQNSKFNYFLADWEVSGIATVQTGAPWTPYVSADISQTEHPERPNWSGQNPYPAQQTVHQWAYGITLPDGSPGPFSIPAPYTFGNAGRDILNGSGLGAWDFSLIRKFPLTESKTLEFRAEMFNILNSPNFETPNSNVSASNFGQIYNTVQPIAGIPSGGPGDPRELQFALKFSW
jgi:outer membrane receptor protein involved in Fe transport